MKRHEEGRAIWNKGPEPIDDEWEVRERTAADFARMKPSSSLPPEHQHILREIQRGNLALCPDEEKFSIPVSLSIAKRFQTAGAGWEKRVDAALRQWLDEHSAS